MPYAKKISCIYILHNLKSEKYYIGSTCNFFSRVSRHKRELNNGTHHNKYLQRSYLKNGADSFCFDILEYCSKDTLHQKEQKWIDFLKPDYNIGAVSGGDNYTNHPQKEEVYKKIIKNLEKSWKNPIKRYGEENPNWKGGKSSFICPSCEKKCKNTNQQTCSDCRNRSGKNNPFYGKKHSQETKKKLSIKRKGKKPTNSKKIKIKGTLYESQADAAEALGVSPATITYRIKKGLI